MTVWYLLNNVLVGTNQHLVGERIDDAVESTAAVIAAGGQLRASTVQLAAAALVASSMHRLGVPPSEIAEMMMAVQLVAAAYTVDVTALTRHETFVKPQAAATVLKSIVETAANANVTTQINCPTNLQVVWDAGWSGGDLVITGVGPDGSVQTETFTANPGGTTVGVKPFISINPNGIVDVAPAAVGADTASVQVGAMLGLAATQATTAFKLMVDGVQEAISAQSGANRTVTPTTVKANTKYFDVWYYATHAHALV